jgi:hypothetical protein
MTASVGADIFRTDVLEERPELALPRRGVDGRRPDSTTVSTRRLTDVGSILEEILYL